MRNRYGYYSNPAHMRGVDLPYKPAKRVVTYFEGQERKRRSFSTEEEASEFKATLPKSAQAIQHSN